MSFIFLMSDNYGLHLCIEVQLYNKSFDRTKVIRLDTEFERNVSNICAR